MTINLFKIYTAILTTLFFEQQILMRQKKNIYYETLIIFLINFILIVYSEQLILFQMDHFVDSFKSP